MKLAKGKKAKPANPPSSAAAKTTAAKSSPPPNQQRKPLISGNWKMNFTHLQAIQFVQQLGYLLEKDDYEHVEVSLHPPFVDLRSVQTVLSADRIPIQLGAQTCHEQDSGAFTGEVSPEMLAALSVSYVIIGHSERRELFGETDELVAAKLQAALRHNLRPILAVGETLTERQENQTQAKLTRQLEAALAGLKPAQLPHLVVAYEPIWAIGTGMPATAEDAEESCAHIRSELARLLGKPAADSIRIQYGGSVKPITIADLMAQPNIDGALVGGASLVAEDFARIVRYRLEG